ncbi:MAG: hypothetical protein CL858_15040 [Cupriavidus sp.]|uniref:IS66 family transposase n=1 Tax=Cupriavidus basilensis TaxID=68895 RepID=UPI0004B688D1|nr:transposase [Cupriavidus basilensis]MBU66750.1 hypothetical protein [Cupriavidus sp.]MDF3889029.1 transposase [Cupriavidus basilensis]
MPKYLPRTRIEYDLSEAQKASFNTLELLGEERSETLHYEPARLSVIEHIRFKYVATKDGESTIVPTAAQPSPLPKSNASAGLLASIQVDTFVDHLPINRQETRYARLHLPRATLCEWKLASAELLATQLPLLRNNILQVQRLNLDDTTQPLLERGRATTRQAHLWEPRGRAAARERLMGRPPASGAVRVRRIPLRRPSPELPARL